MPIQHFLTLMDLSPKTLDTLIDRAIELKQLQRQGKGPQPLLGKSLAMIFEKSSTRTRVSFEVGMTQLGGHALFLSSNDTQLGRGEPLPDSARVLSRMADGIMIRNDSQADLEAFASYSSAPVINALTDQFHPCQLLADMQTYREHRGSIAGRRVVFLGDGNNVCQSYINAARQFDFELIVSCPDGYTPNAELMASASSHVQIEADPMVAAKDADLIATDVWTSMGQEEETQRRLRDLADFQVNSALMKQAKGDALFQHCLPAHRGEEVTAEVIDGPQSVVWDEAENRLHAQKALLEYLMAE